MLWLRSFVARRGHGGRRADPRGDTVARPDGLSRALVTPEQAGSRRGGGWSWIMAVIALVVATIATGALQGLSVPGGGTAKAGAAVTPLPTASQPHGGRVPPAASRHQEIGSALHSDIGEPGRLPVVGVQLRRDRLLHTAPGHLRRLVGQRLRRCVRRRRRRRPTSTGRCRHPMSRYAPTSPVDSIAGTGDSKGYWMATAGGGVFAFGDAGWTAPDRQAGSQQPSWPWWPTTTPAATGWSASSARSSPTAGPTTTAGRRPHW